MHKDVEKILVTEEEIKTAVSRIAEKINSDLDGEPFLVVVILKGSTPFAMDLIKHLDMPVEIDFMQASSYGKSTESSGFINMKKATLQIIILTQDLLFP